MISRQQITYLILLAALCILPFILELNVFPFVRDTILDYRSTKEIVSILFATGIFLWALTGGHAFKIKNLGILLFLGYMIMHPLVSPPFELQAFNQNIAGFWEYKYMSYVLIYTGMFSVVSNMNWSRERIDTVLKIMMWTGTISSFYIFIQWFGLDQFQKLAGGSAKNVTGATLTATFTQPNYSGLYIALMVPIAIYFKKPLAICSMIIAVLLINSKMALLTMIVGGSFILIRQYHKIIVGYLLPLITIFIMFLITVFYYSHSSNDWSDNGRFGLWQVIFNACTHPWISEINYFITGHGFGSYGYIFTSTYTWAMNQAHNEYLQLLFDSGIVGLSFLLFSIFWLIKRINPFTITDSQTIVLMAMFLAILVSAIGLFTWQIEPHRFISVVVFALLHNKLIKHED